jgi:hypothetical protein
MNFGKEIMMKTWLLVLVILGFVLPTPVILGAAWVHNAEILEYGTYNIEITKEIKDNSAVEGKSFKVGKKIKLIKKTNKIPATKDLAFGIRYIIHGSPLGEKVKIRKIMIYPRSGLRNPETGKVGYKKETASHIKIGDKKLYGYIFGQEWLMVPGDWTFQLWYEGRELAERTFTVHIP